MSKSVREEYVIKNGGQEWGVLRAFAEWFANRSQSLASILISYYSAECVSLNPLLYLVMSIDITKAVAGSEDCACDNPYYLCSHLFIGVVASCFCVFSCLFISAGSLFTGFTGCLMALA